MTNADVTPMVDPEDDPRGRRDEARALALLASAAVAAVGLAAALGAGVLGGRGRALTPPAESERFVVDVNCDDWPAIALLPRIGEKLAREIVAERERGGPFTDANDLERVRGIGRKMAERLRPLVRFGAPATRPR